MRNAFKFLNVAVQALLLATISLSIIFGAIAGEPHHYSVALLFALPLGVWQIVSAIVTSIACDSYEHGWYGFGAISYCLISVGMIYLFDQIDSYSPLNAMDISYLWLFFWPLPPVVGAFWYFNRSFRDYQSL